MKKNKMQVALLLIMAFLIGCDARWVDKTPKIFEFKYEAFKFLNGDIELELPDNPQSKSVDGRYYKVLANKFIDFTSGHFEISAVDIDKYKGSKKEEFKNKWMIREIRDVSSNELSIARIAIWYGESPIILQITTSSVATTFPTSVEREARIRKDDEIFNHIVESFRYRKADGTYAKAEIIRQAEEVKEVERTGAEYHGNGK